MSTDEITPDSIVHVEQVLGHPEWTDVLALVVANVYRHGCRFVRLRMWPCGAFPEMSSVTSVPLVGLSLVAPPVPETAGGEPR